MSNGMEYLECPRCRGTGKIDNPKFFGDLIRHARCLMGLSLRQAAKRLGYSAAYLSDVELGRRNPSQKVRQFYGVYYLQESVREVGD